MPAFVQSTPLRIRAIVVVVCLGRRKAATRFRHSASLVRCPVVVHEPTCIGAVIGGERRITILAMSNVCLCRLRVHSAIEASRQGVDFLLQLRYPTIGFLLALSRRGGCDAGYSEQDVDIALERTTLTIGALPLRIACKRRWVG